MNFFDYQNSMYSRPAMDDTIADVAAATAREQQAEAPHGEAESAKQIAEFSDKDKILSAEELQEHRKHCRAKPGNCPFEKAVDEADDITPNDINVTKQDAYNRLAAVLTQLFQVSKNLAKPAIADPEMVEEEAAPTNPDGSSKTSEKGTQDEAPQPDEPNSDAKIVAEVLEGGIERMVELAKARGCLVDMDEKSTKYIVKGPSKDKQEEQ
jgi:hypothetical protein